MKKNFGKILISLGFYRREKLRESSGRQIEAHDAHLVAQGGTQPAVGEDGGVVEGALARPRELYAPGNLARTHQMHETAPAGDHRLALREGDVLDEVVVCGDDAPFPCLEIESDDAVLRLPLLPVLLLHREQPSTPR